MANILVVDDEPDVLEAFARALRLAGHNVTSASNASDAIALSEEHAFDLAVLDYIMPTMKGIELLNKLRIAQPTIRSIIVSGQIDSTIGEDTLRVELKNSIEADDYLHKPVSSQKLLNSITQILDRNAGRGWKAIGQEMVSARKTVARVKSAELEFRKKKVAKKK